ncbi:staphylopine uptake ABC transporter ATP-binding protein CntD [Staphylococcus caprae]|uniref:Oligopeptide transporter putative ATPase domain n=1 Tax=Staphylococcus caprae TaxID=29380 RepID=A0ABM7FR86_9STAP|nr:ABC transporter ATP-binding protein [Staphylococcus caprae]EES41327.1 ABC transporter, ATP-binding protein [Staphylococcus caprae M23864:W1]MBN6826806.1 ABC transporter ATP-binding protein [Staphylococcus caprae]MBX5316673.1 ABC transporter ATP-binding protein [Staphylococcus caprae]MBX5323857.1 ABC transporter ATP-binding protein [Staphylococcus caprae]MDI0015564.1 ABC transporter ATP-binding protein [Staphylococcus caprae]
MTLLSVENLRIMDVWTHTTLVEEVNFKVTQGETLGMIGESGSGKSITCKALLGLNPERFRVSGDIYFENENLMHLSQKDLRSQRGKHIAMVMQHGARAFDPSAKVGKQMMETMRAHTTLTKTEVKQTLVKYMTYINLKQPEIILDAYPHMLSGGMLQRLMIALALALKPKLIIADEPTTALDTITQYDVLEAFQDIKRHFDCAMIFISHDLTVINQLADRVIVMKEGRLVESGPTEDVLHHPRHAYTKYLLSTKKKVSDHFQRVMRGEVNAQNHTC